MEKARAHATKPWSQGGDNLRKESQPAWPVKRPSLTRRSNAAPYILTPALTPNSCPFFWLARGTPPTSSLDSRCPHFHSIPRGGDGGPEGFLEKWIMEAAGTFALHSNFRFEI